MTFGSASRVATRAAYGMAAAVLALTVGGCNSFNSTPSSPSPSSSSAWEVPVDLKNACVSTQALEGEDVDPEVKAFADEMLRAAGFEPIPSEAFSLPLSVVMNMLRSADGMQPYEPQTGWETFPKRNKDIWGVGFTNDGQFLYGEKGKADGELSFEEAALLLHQLAWDSKFGPSQGEGLNPDPISPELARKAAQIFGQLFWHHPDTSPAGRAGQLRENVDPNGDRVFTAEDIIALAKRSQCNN